MSRGRLRSLARQIRALAGPPDRDAHLRQMSDEELTAHLAELEQEIAKQEAAEAALPPEERAALKATREALAGMTDEELDAEIAALKAEIAEAERGETCVPS